MTDRTLGRRSIVAIVAGAAALGSTTVAWATNDIVDPSTDLYVEMTSSRVTAAAALTGEERADALRLAAYPAATWLTAGTPAEVQGRAAEIVTAAEAADEVPTLVAYNIPFRDCAQYSAGGATSQAEYEAWIDAVAAGIGDADALVILEPDGLGIIPWYTNLDGALEWCQPAEADPATAAAERFAMLNHAVDVLTALPNTAVYLDGTHSAWLNVGDISDRLAKAGVAEADGFYLNASNYQWTENLVQYGTWISACLAGGAYAGCANQYWNGGPDGTKIAELLGAWTGVGLVGSGVWSDASDIPELNTSGINARYAGATPTTHFVIDTSRNGQGPWTPDAVYPDPQDWCNPPDRGLGLRPTADTGNDLVDAYLWIKIPGESDGQCTRGTAGPVDPARGIVDPPAGGWFPEQARELIELAVPPLAPPTCDVSYTVHGTWPQGFITQVWIKNTGTTTIRGWELRFAFGGNQTIDHAWSTAVSQVGDVVTATNLSWNASIAPGARTTFGFVGRTDAGPNPEPLLFLLNGAGCTVS
jgi:endoglucanase